MDEEIEIAGDSTVKIRDLMPQRGDIPILPVINYRNIMRRFYLTMYAVVETCRVAHLDVLTIVHRCTE